jgi:hypothetical protein
MSKESFKVNSDELDEQRSLSGTTYRALAELDEAIITLLPMLVPLVTFPQMSLIARLPPDRAKIGLMVILGRDTCVGKKTD